MLYGANIRTILHPALVSLLFLSSHCITDIIRVPAVMLSCSVNLHVDAGMDSQSVGRPSCASDLTPIGSPGLQMNARCGVR